MLDLRGHIKLVDFGLAMPIEGAERPMSATGSLIYMPPEMIREQMGGRHTDWWAVGVLAHELLTGTTPWSSLDNKKAIEREILGMAITPPMYLSSPAGHLVCSLMRQDHRRRLGTRADSDVKAAPFFAGVNWLKLARQEGPPAFTPCLASESIAGPRRREALESYWARLARTASPTELPWAFGLDMVSEAPLLDSSLM